MISFTIVLGNSNIQILNSRLNKGISEFFKTKNYEDEEDVYGIHNFIILSGRGNGINFNDKTYSSEAEYMFEYVSKYIQTKYIILESNSNNTFENLTNCYKLISNRYPIHQYNGNIHVNICTSSFHIKRSLVIATLLNKNNYNLNFFHTNEKFTEDINKKELKHLDNFLNHYSNNFSNQK